MQKYAHTLFKGQNIFVLIPGYYADVLSECQSFHVCHPVVYQDGFEEIFKWTFACPNQTVFDQVLILFLLLS